jgi:hypothetical protein
VAPAPAPATATAETFIADSAKATPDALMAILPMPPSRAPKAPAPVAPEAPPPAAPTAAPAPAPTTAAATPSPETTAAPATPPEDPENFTVPKNYRLHARDPKEAMMLLLIRQGKAAPDAYKEAYGSEAAPAVATPATPAAASTQPTPAVEPESPLKALDSQITTLGTEVADLQTQIDAAKAEEDFKTAIDLVQQQGRKERLLEETKARREGYRNHLEQRQVDEATENYRQAQAESAQAVIEKFPQLADLNGEGRAAFNLMNKQLRADPRWASVFDSPQWPEVVARRVAEEQGWFGTRQAPAAPAAPQAPAAPTATATPRPPMSTPANPLAPQQPAQAPSAATRATAAEVISPAASSSGATFTPSADTFQRDLESMPAAQRRDALFQLLGHAPIDPRLARLAGKRG